MKKILLTALLALSSQAFAINKCDELAADPDNKDIAQGVNFQDLQAEPAIKACLKALSQEPNHARYQFQLGRAYYKKQDYQNAVKWLEKSAINGYAEAQFRLATIYSKGEIVEENNKIAAKWYRKAAEQGDALAQYNLGIVYYDGDGLEKDIEQAIEWWKKSAKQGEKHAQQALQSLGITN